jgi:hypothetical protein
MKPVVILLFGAAAGALFAKQRPRSTRNLLRHLDRTGASQFINNAAIAALPKQHPVTIAARHLT